MTRISLVLFVTTAFLLSSCKSDSSRASTGGAAVVDSLPTELASVTDSSFSLDQLKTSISSLSGDKLTALADKLLGAAEGQDGIVKQLSEGVGALGLGDGGEGKLDSAKKLLGELKDKLTVVVDKLKESGLDVSKYTAFLNG